MTDEEFREIKDRIELTLFFGHGHLAPYYVLKLVRAIEELQLEVTMLKSELKDKK